MDRVHVGVGIKIGLDFLGVEPVGGADFGEDAKVPDIAAVDEVFNEQRLGHLVGEPAFVGKANKAVGIDRIGRLVDAVEGEIDLDGLAGLADGAVDAPDPGFAAELLDQIGGAVDAFRGHFRIQQKRPPVGLGLDLRAHGQGHFQPPFADIAPGADGIEDDVDFHSIAGP